LITLFYAVLGRYQNLANTFTPSPEPYLDSDTDDSSTVVDVQLQNPVVGREKRKYKKKASTSVKRRIIELALANGDWKLMAKH